MSKKKKRGGFGDNMSSEAAQHGQGASYGYITLPKGLDIFKAKADTTVLMDFIPYNVTSKGHADKKFIQDNVWWKLPFKIHRKIGANDDTIVCPTTFGKKCPICEYVAELREDYDKNEDEIKALKTSKRNLYAVRVLEIDGVKQKKAKIQLFDFSDYNFQELFVKQLKATPEWKTFPDYEEGVSLKVVFDEEVLGKNKFPKGSRFDWVKRKKQYEESIIDEAPELDKVLTVDDYDTVKALFADLPEEEDKPEKKKKKGKKEKEEPVKEKSKKKKKKEPEPEPEKKKKKSKKEPEPKKKGKKDKKGKKK